MRNFGVGYDIVLVLHILTVVVGFGGVLLNGVYGAQAKAAGPVGGAAIAKANFHVSENWAGTSILLVFPLGLALVIMGGDTWGFDQTWVSASMGMYIVAVGISQAVMRPMARKMLGLLDEMAAAPAGAAGDGPPPQVAEVEALGKRIGSMGGLLTVLFLVILVLMVVKPGVAG